MQKFEQKFVIAFLIILWMPLFQMIFRPFAEVPLEENRTLTARPNFELSEKAANQFTDFFNDHFGFRGSLVRANTLIDLKFFQTSPNPNVIVGKNGWLFYGDSIKSLSQPVAQNDIDRIADHIKNLQENLHHKNITFLFFIAPNKETIYPEFMRKPMPNREHNYDALMSALTQRGITTIDTRSILVGAKTSANPRLYSAEDSHWTRYGLLLTLNSLFQKLNLPTLDINTTVPTTRIGDLIKLLGFTSSEEVPEPVILQSPTIKKGRVLLYHDSFMNNETFISMVFENFTKVHWIYEPMGQSITKNLPNHDIFIWEIAERSIPGLVNYDFPGDL